MTIVSDLGIRRMEGRPFEDILDGYFPLRESIRQLLQRQGFSAMWITLLHAPFMKIEGLAEDAPVPLHLRKIYSGMIDHMLLLAFSTPDGMGLAGTGDWIFVDSREENDLFPDGIRLGEPAFVRGVGLINDCDAFDEVNDFAPLAFLTLGAPLPSGDEVRLSAVQYLGWQAGKCFALKAANLGIRRQVGRDVQTLPFGSDHRGTETSWDDWPLPMPEHLRPADWLLVNASPDQVRRQSLEVALRL
ncbi:hypothetical protein [Labrenzia sp. CE80]|uniref:hypothetical protein n=1 Tax=Labrenzia sp. CE80 TaxID=1788986 RepID=UPI00129B3279|nr:hypothetical protein [Labrenzia sp. CE80]